jgi:DNA-binding winged helix-turn-helix (wHTH) protein/TolB-like protein
MSSGRFRFGLFEFDLDTRELRREGVLLRLQSQPAQVLAYLVEHAGQTVTREELIKEIWGTETHVDFDRGLNFCIGQIRSALEDDSVSPRYIRTLPKRGYQFIAPVERVKDRMSSSRERQEEAAGGGGIDTPANGKRRTWYVAPAEAGGRKRIGFVAAAAVCAGVALMALAASAGYMLRSWQSSRRQPVVAVVRFDNETNDPGMARFSDGLTDNVVERLTALSLGKYDVIGNARILRLPRDQRDLSAIASSLHASYVVMGQVQNNGAQTRILVHLIRLPDQKHLWVARLDRTITDSDYLQLESEAAKKVGAEFSERIVNDSSGSPLPEAPSR